MCVCVCVCVSRPSLFSQFYVDLTCQFLKKGWENADAYIVKEAGKI